ncbi:MAG: adenosine deaminase [Thermomicrobiales bacterium]|nr:adenosine deaminase [Thermomicrobiales bacterium]
MQSDHLAISPALEAFIRRMPKAEIHVHLEGSVRPETLLMLAERNGQTPPAPDVEGLRQFFQFRDFPHFIDVYIAVCTCLRTPEDFADIVREVGEDAAAQNIRYLEMHFNPETNVRKRGLDFHEMLAGMNRGRREARERWGVEIRWIADGVRDSETSPFSVTRTVDWITALSPADGVVALGLGGDEVGHPPAPFAADFARARQGGLRTVAHAGETTGAETVRASLDLLGAERIGHGVRAWDDPALVQRLIDLQVPLEVCPTSNLCTRVAPSYAEHPFPALDAAGVLVTVNSDDPPLFGTTLTEEFLVLARHWGYDADGVQRIALNGLDASFLPDAEKARLRGEFLAEYATLRDELGLPPSERAAAPLR